MTKQQIVEGIRRAMKELEDVAVHSVEDHDCKRVAYRIDDGLRHIRGALREAQEHLR